MVGLYINRRRPCQGRCTQTVAWRTEEIQRDSDFKTPLLNPRCGINRYVYTEPVDRNTCSFRYVCLLDCFQTTDEFAWLQHVTSIRHQNSVEAYEKAARGEINDRVSRILCNFRICREINNPT